MLLIARARENGADDACHPDFAKFHLYSRSESH
jgi:hypothetical protein